MDNDIIKEVNNYNIKNAFDKYIKSIKEKY